MASEETGRSSTNPFDDDIEEDPRPISAPPPVPYLPFVKVPILIICTVIVFVLLIAGTATTALSYPPLSQTSNSSHHIALNGDYKVLGPLLLTAGCFMLVVNIALCGMMTREAFLMSRSVRPGSEAVNGLNSGQVSLVGGPFYIATTNSTMAQPLFLPFLLGRPWWVHPDAPTSDQQLDGKGMPQVRSSTATLHRHRQPPFNPENDEPISGA